MGRNRKPDRVVSTIQTADGKWLVSYVIKGKKGQAVRKTELAARARANELQAQIDGQAQERAEHIATAIAVAREAGEDGDWRKLLWEHAQRVNVDPSDEAAQRAGRVLADLARADLAIRRQQKGEMGEGEARRLLDDPEIAARVDALLAAEGK